MHMHWCGEGACRTAGVGHARLEHEPLMARTHDIVVSPRPQSRDKAESDSRPNTHACHATSINKGQCCRTMLKMKNSSVSLSMLKVLRTCLAASQLTLNGAKESPWRCQCFLSYYNYYKIGYFCMGCRSSNWAPTCI